MISIRGLSKTFNQSGQRVNALRDINLEVDAGDVFGVVGPSGAGKSTLVRCVNLLEKPDAGTITVAGKEMTSLGEVDLQKARQRIGMIFQHFNLLSSRDVSGNVAFPLEVAGVPKAAQVKRVAELLDLVGLSDKARAYPAQLSGGQKQRVGIARALANQPDVLLSDEATSALDPASTQSILELLKDLNKRFGLTILLITHEMEVVKQICDHVAMFEDGRLAEQGAIRDLIADPGSRLSKAFFPPIEADGVDPDAVSAAISFIGESADEPILTKLARSYDVEMNILGGNIQSIAGMRVGQLQVEFKGAQVEAALEHLKRIGLQVEVRR